jgi:hypothetical protein
MARKTEKTLTDNIGTIRLSFEDIKRTIDGNAKETDKIKRIESIISKLYD